MTWFLLVAAAPPAAPSVLYRNGRLSVRAEGVPLAAVLHAIEAKTGVRFHGEPLDQRDVWKHFDDVPLAEGLRRVIGRQNFTLTYGDDGGPLRVDLGGVPTPRTVRASARVARPSLSVLWRTEAVPVSARVASIVGRGPTVALSQLTPAFRSDDAAVRRDAIGALLFAVGRNPALRSALVALTDDQTAAFARALGGSHAADVLRTIVARTVDGDVRRLAYRAATRL